MVTRISLRYTVDLIHMIKYYFSFLYVLYKKVSITRLALSACKQVVKDLFSMILSWSYSVPTRSRPSDSTVSVISCSCCSEHFIYCKLALT